MIGTNARAIPDSEILIDFHPPRIRLDGLMHDEPPWLVEIR